MAEENVNPFSSGDYEPEEEELEEETQDEGEEQEEEEEEEVETETEDEGEELDEDDEDALEERFQHLVSIARSQQQKIGRLEAQIENLGRSKKQPAEDYYEYEEEESEGRTSEVPLYSKLEDRLQYLHQTRKDALNLQFSDLARTEGYEDIEDVVNADTISDLVELVSPEIAKEYGISDYEATLVARNMIMEEDNPAAFLYDSIKQYHPAFRTEGRGRERTEPVTNVKTIANVGSETPESGWTAKKLDALDETELDKLLDQKKIPWDTYEKYMLGELK